MTKHQPATDRPGKARPPVGRARRFFGLSFSIALLGAAYFSYPRQADLTAFDAAAMARLETAMWRDCAEKRYVALFRDRYDAGRNQYGFSPLVSVELAFTAARAAKAFQPSTSRAEAEAALPFLNSYFGNLAQASNRPIEVEDVARTELAWWQARREAVAADQYGPIIARVATMLYGVDGEDVRRFGMARAQAMAYRDARGVDMTEADWARISERLEVAYGLLKNALSNPLPPAQARRNTDGP
jgi:hypothetical protein